MDHSGVAASGATALATATESPTRPSIVPAKERLLSLDVFRGFTLLGMVLVNSHPGKIFPGLGHATWNGWGFADLIFSFFVSIVGVAMPYSFANRLARGDSCARLFWQVLRRCALLFAVGVFLNGFPRFHLATLRVMNALSHRFGIGGSAPECRGRAAVGITTTRRG